MISQFTNNYQALYNWNLISFDHMGMFKNNEAFHFKASYAHVCLDFKDQTSLKYVLWSLCSSS